MTDGTDRELYEQFHALRREAAAGAPEFRATLARLARRHERNARLGRRVAIAVAVAAALVLFAVGRPRKQAIFVDLAAVRWEGPTDFLLRAPGAELLRTIPTFTPQGRLLP